MNDLDYSAVEKILGTEPEGIAEMPDEIKEKMKNVLETIVVRTDEDRNELYNALDRLWQKGTVLVTLKDVSKATGIPYLTLSNLDSETQQIIVFEYLADSANSKQIYMFVNDALAVKELPRNECHVESMTEAQAVEVMAALSAVDVAFSAASRSDDKVAITVSKKDIAALNDIMYSAIGKIAKTDAVRENAGKGEKGKYQTINPEYYASLSKEQRHSRVEATEAAREIVKGLIAEKIPYSAVVRKNDTVAITVSKDNAKAYKQIENKVKGVRAAEYINPEFYKALPKEFRVTLPMNEEQAKAKVAELDKKGIAHSAVLNGERSAVTVSKKDQGRAFFSRSQLKNEVHRINGQGKKQPQKQKSPKKKNTQGLG